MRYDAILFDMDGTLLPMDQKVFVKQYFVELAKAYAPLHIEMDDLKAAFWSGIKAMVENDGNRTNEIVFWEALENVLGKEIDLEQMKSISEEFYDTNYQDIRAYVGENPLAVRAVELAHELADHVVLATNPLFPRKGQLGRLRWVGLGEKDFDKVTAFEEQYYCKPNPKFYLEICKDMGVKPENCLMIGNDELEDMHVASSLGMDCYMITDSVILREGYTWEGKQGSFEELVDWLQEGDAYGNNKSMDKTT